MAIEWLTDDGDDKDPPIAAGSGSDNPINADYFEESAPVDITPAMEEAILAFEKLNLGAEELDTFIDLAYRMDTTGLVSRSDAQAARAVLVDFDSKASLKAYTVHPSKTRYQCAMESMSGGMIAMLAAAAAAVIGIVYMVLKAIFGRSDPVTAAKIAKLDDKKNPTTSDLVAVANAVPAVEETVRAQEEVASAAEELVSEVVERALEGIPDLLDKAFRAGEIRYVAFENKRNGNNHHITNVNDYNKALFAYMREVEPTILQEHEWPFRSAAFAVAGEGEAEVARTMDEIAKVVELRGKYIVGWASDITNFLAGYKADTPKTEAEINAFRALNADYSGKVNGPIKIPHVNSESGGTINTLPASIKYYFEETIKKHRRLSIHNLNDLIHFFNENPLYKGAAPGALRTILKNRKVFMDSLIDASKAMDLVTERLNEIRTPQEGGLHPDIAREISGAIGDIRAGQRGLTMSIGVLETELHLYDSDFATLLRVLSETLKFVHGLNIGLADDVTQDKATNVNAMMELIAKLKEKGEEINKKCESMNKLASNSSRELARFARDTVTKRMPHIK